MATRKKRRPSTLIALVLLASLGQVAAMPASAGDKPVAAKPAPLPGSPLELYTTYYPGLQKTGGLVTKGTAPGYEFEIYEGKRGKEYLFSPSFLPCDPMDTEGLTYLPRLSLLVMRTPDGKRFVLSETKQKTFAGSKELNRFLIDSEKAAALRVPPASNLLEKLRRWYFYNFQNEKSYHPIYGDGQVKILHAKLGGGTLGSLLLVPDWATLVKDDEEGTSKVGGVLKRIDYVDDYQQIALDNLYRFVRKTERKNH